MSGTGPGQERRMAPAAASTPAWRPTAVRPRGPHRRPARPRPAGPRLSSSSTGWATLSAGPPVLEGRAPQPHDVEVAGPGDGRLDERAFPDPRLTPEHDRAPRAGPGLPQDVVEVGELAVAGDQAPGVVPTALEPIAPERHGDDGSGVGRRLVTRLVQPVAFKRPARVPLGPEGRSVFPTPRVDDNQAAGRRRRESSEHAPAADSVWPIGSVRRGRLSLVEQPNRGSTKSGVLDGPFAQLDGAFWPHTWHELPKEKQKGE